MTSPGKTLRGMLNGFSHSLKILTRLFDADTWRVGGRGWCGGLPAIGGSGSASNGSRIASRPACLPS